MEESILQIILITTIVGTLSVVIAIALVRLWDSYQKSRGSGQRFRQSDVVFLFDNKKLTNATPSAQHLLAGIFTSQDEWHRLMSWIGPHFPNAIEQIEKIKNEERINLNGKSRIGTERFHLLAEGMANGRMRIVLSATESVASMRPKDGGAQRLVEEELQLLRQATEQMPSLVWRQDQTGQIVWANPAYLKYVGLTHDGVIGWPLPHLLSPPKASGEVETCRDKFIVDGKVIWFDCYECNIGEQTIFYALPADAAVQAERNLRDFVQTLTKTFVGLQTGLAIFDRQRNLQLFNPALVELTQLPIELLVSRPTLADFLDQLRERRMVPEPKNFRSWQRQIINLEKSASDGYHLEEWSLPGGQTYRVTGRPHNDGAIAFAFEDISTETVKNRELREAFVLNKEILDELNEAVIVFGLNDQPVLVNQAYLSFWGEPGDSQSDIIAQWTEIASGAELAKLEENLRSVDIGKHVNGSLTLNDGRVVDWSVFQISGGQRAIRFTPDTPVFRGKSAALSAAKDPIISDKIYEN